MENIKEIAIERISILFDLASKEFKEHPELSRRYVELAKRISMRVKVSIPRIYKERFCKKCGSYLVLGNNAIRRLNKGLIEITCYNCKNVRRFGYK